LRLFIGIPIEGDARAVLADTIESLRPRLRSARWVRPANLHFTLRFLGEVPDSEVPTLEAWLRTHVRAVEPGFLRLAHTGWFSRRDRLVLWVGIESGAWLQSLANALAEAVASVPAETRPFAAHVTLARHEAGRGEREQVPEFLRQFRQLDFRSVPPQPVRVVLYESRLGGGAGAEYRELVSLGPAR
jgi:RNA 2',3'-cyclic 3'-phosphodiesterase